MILALRPALRGPFSHSSNSVRRPSMRASSSSSLLELDALQMLRHGDPREDRALAAEPADQPLGVGHRLAAVEDRTRRRDTELVDLIDAIRAERERYQASESPNRLQTIRCTCSSTAVRISASVSTPI